MILCDRPCSNKSEYGYCNTTYCINPAIPNTAVGYFPPPRLIKTNADRIRSMTDEELAEFLDRWELGDIDYSKTFCDLCEGQYDCHDDCLMDWLKEEVKDV